jgi:trimethylamine--corrinoid protein Co-methyltransferase
MGPVTNAGAIAQSLAETMVGCALTQLERPGAPVVFGNFLSSTALRTGSPTFGTPEPAIGSMVIGQLARRLNLPLRCSGNFTTSKLPDAQAMTEGTMSMLAAIHCGANFILHSAGFLDGLLSMSYEKFMLDADLCGALHTYLDGVKIDENQLAEDAFTEVGPGNHFFGSAHTLANYETAYWDSGRPKAATTLPPAPTGSGSSACANTKRRRWTRPRMKSCATSSNARRPRCRMPGTKVQPAVAYPIALETAPARRVSGRFASASAGCRIPTCI